MWKQIMEEFVTILDLQITGNEISLMNKWSTIQKYIHKFSSYVQTNARNLVSGYNNVDAVCREFSSNYMHIFVWCSNLN